jgi:hypothetical protein
VAGVLQGEGVDFGRDPRRIETPVGLGPGDGHNAVHEISGYRTARALSLTIVNPQQDRAVLTRFSAMTFSPNDIPWQLFSH